MGTIEEGLLQILEPQEPKPSNNVMLPLRDASFTKQRSSPERINYNWWLLVSFYTVCLLIAQTGATLLGRFYFENGGNSKWLAAFVMSAGFPHAIPFLLFSSGSSLTSDPSNTAITTTYSITALALIYVGIGLLVSGNSLMYSYGLLYLPVSTYSLLCATQLAFNALFSYFLNSLKFTAFIINSIVLLTISASILALHPESTGPSNISIRNYIIGFLCTIGASALYSLVLSLTQLCFEKVLKGDTFRVILEIQIYPALVATCVSVVGLCASGELRKLKGEMERFTTGKLSYVMTVFWTIVLWQVFSISCLGLIYEASSLLSNVVSTVGLPIVPIFAVVLFHDNMNGMKVVALVLAVWGFISYFYQHYLDDEKTQSLTTTNTNDPSA